ncbi:hypothetical protein EV421DRAFT_1852473 [Armillaria borealis]|uniref:Uncharacterized protein n=1 Tax=Armillaria borealis TaxID=47425 RepID=A0AA39IYW9_9AGAR|nr:hypothetical protein EV421DRAFT_1852473 [Armillaria borealis]
MCRAGVGACSWVVVSCFVRGTVLRVEDVAMSWMAGEVWYLLWVVGTAACTGVFCFAAHSSYFTVSKISQRLKNIV